jgi:hypothetical protein
MAQIESLNRRLFSMKVILRTALSKPQTENIRAETSHAASAQLQGRTHLLYIPAAALRIKDLPTPSPVQSTVPSPRGLNDARYWDYRLYRWLRLV